MNYLERGVVLSAVVWWKGKKPCEWDLEEHLEQPEVNTNTDAEKMLANNVANYVGGIRCTGRQKTEKR